VLLEGKFLLIALVIVRITFLKHFDNVFATCGNNIVEVFEKFATSF
jgi:hypothetical protein